MIQNTPAESEVKEKRTWRWLIPPDDQLEVPNDYTGVEYMDPDATLPPRYIAVAIASSNPPRGLPVVFIEFWKKDGPFEIRPYRSIWSAGTSGKERPEVIAEAKTRLGIDPRDEQSETSNVAPNSPMLSSGPETADILDKVNKFFEDSEAATDGDDQLPTAAKTKQ